MSVRSHAVWSAGAAIALVASRFALLAILARRLDQSTLGVFTYAQWLVDIAFLFASLGATGAASRYIAEYRSQPALLQAFVGAWRLPSLLLPLAGAALVVGGASLSGASPGFAEQAALFVWALFSGLWAMQTAALTGLQRFDLVFLSNLLAAVTMVAGAALMPASPEGPLLAFLIMAAGCAAGFAVGLVPVRRLNASAKEQAGTLDRRPIIRYCINVWITALLWTLVWSRGEVPLVRHFLGDAPLAHYSVALGLAGGAIAGVMLGVGGIAPEVTRLLGGGKVDAAVRLCRVVGDWQLLASVSAAMLLIWFAPELLRLAFGPEYVAAAPALCLLAAGIPALSFSMHNHLLQIQTGARFNRNTTLLGLAVLAIAALLLIPRFGIAGAALARMAAMWVLAFTSAAVFSSLAGAGGINRLGFGAVMLATGASASAVLLVPDVGFWIRATSAVSIPVVFVFLIRGIDGGLAIQAIAGKVARQ